MEWRKQAYESLNSACIAIGDNYVQSALILLDNATGLIAQGHLIEKGKAPKTKRAEVSPPIRTFLRAMVDNAEPRVPKSRLNLLLNLHDTRGILYHKVSQGLTISRERCLVFLRETLAFAKDYGVQTPKLVPGDLPIEQPIAEILLEFGDKWDPRRRPESQTEFVLEVMKRYGLLAGIITNANWPLVRCSLCRKLVLIDHIAITQNDFSEFSNALALEEQEYLKTYKEHIIIRPYCLFGCVQAYQAYMREYEKEYIKMDPDDYYVQGLLFLLTGESKDDPFH